MDANKLLAGPDVEAPETKPESATKALPRRVTLRALFNVCACVAGVMCLSVLYTSLACLSTKNLDTCQLNMRMFSFMLVAEMCWFSAFSALMSQGGDVGVTQFTSPRNGLRPWARIAFDLIVGYSLIVSIATFITNAECLRARDAGWCAVATRLELPCAVGNLLLLVCIGVGVYVPYVWV